MSIRQPRRLDRVLGHLDRALKGSLGGAPAARPYPASGAGPGSLKPAERRHAAGLMRVNHAGEIAAQALYHGQGLGARSSKTRNELQQAALEENDHLAWCDQRLAELGSRPSRLAPLWYFGSFSLGTLAGLMGDKVSLGFVAETERQVVEHLQTHMARLPANDSASRQIVRQMQIDEAAHGEAALEAGGIELPEAVQIMMRRTARIMTALAYRI